MGISGHLKDLKRMKALIMSNLMVGSGFPFLHTNTLLTML